MKLLLLNLLAVFSIEFCLADNPLDEQTSHSNEMNPSEREEVKTEEEAEAEKEVVETNHTTLFSRATSFAKKSKEKTSEVYAFTNKLLQDNLLTIVAITALGASYKFYILNREIAALQKLLSLYKDKLENQGEVLNSHTPTLNEHADRLSEQADRLNNYASALNKHASALNSHTATINEQASALNSYTATINSYISRSSKHSY